MKHALPTVVTALGAIILISILVGPARAEQPNVLLIYTDDDST